MLKLGEYHTLRIKKRTDYGLYLDGGDEGNILLPNRYVTKDMRIGDEIEVFIYLDQDERTIATTEHPIAKVGEFAWMECAWTNEYGAFLNWGLMKDLFCPFREQKQRMERGKKYYVYVMEDEKTHRLMATAKVERYQKKTGHELALDFSEELLRYLYEHEGHCDLGDKSPAEEIAARFGVSKKVFKQAAATTVSTSSTDTSFSFEDSPTTTPSFRWIVRSVNSAKPSSCVTITKVCPNLSRRSKKS